MQISKNKLTKIITVVFAVTVLVGYVIYSQANRTIRMMSGTKSNACINNLRQIDGAKDQWAIENKKNVGDTVNETEVNGYIKGNTTPQCPAGGTYTYNKVGENPICSKSSLSSGHALPSP